MLPLATDWSTISSLATGAGTLVLAIATFASVRSANRSARVAELALQEQRRPVLTQSRVDDPPQKIMFVEGKWVRAGGSRGVAERDGGNIYLALSLRNVGAGIGVCQGWVVSAGLMTNRAAPTHPPEEEFRLQSRDLYVPAGDIGMWQGALRDPGDPDYQIIAQAIESQDMISIQLLYSDQVGGQRTITRFGMTPTTNPETGEVVWLASVTRHWYLDQDGPRPDSQVTAASEAVLRARDAGEAAREEEARRAAVEAQTADTESDPTATPPAGSQAAATQPAPESASAAP